LILGQKHDLTAGTEGDLFKFINWQMPAVKKTAAANFKDCMQRLFAVNFS
jgi:hypothetical protein